MEKVQFHYPEDSYQEAMQVYIPKVCTDIFKLLKSKTGTALLAKLLELDRAIEFSFFGKVLIYQPHIQPEKKRKEDEINNLLGEKEILSANESIEKSNALLERKEILGTVKFRLGFPCPIAFNTELASVKIVVVKTADEKPCLSYCPRFISTAHELIHVAHTQQNTHYKAIPMDKLPLIKLAYTNLEEFYTIQLDKVYSENSISAELGYSPRIGHLGYANLLLAYTEDKNHTVTICLKDYLIRAGIMLGRLNFEMPAIKAYYEAVRTNWKDIKDELKNEMIESAFKIYQGVFSNLVPELSHLGQNALSNQVVSPDRGPSSVQATSTHIGDNRMGFFSPPAQQEPLSKKPQLVTEENVNEQKKEMTMNP